MSTPPLALLPPAQAVHSVYKCGESHRTAFTHRPSPLRSTPPSCCELLHSPAMVASRIPLSLFLVIALLCMGCCYSATLPRNFDPRFAEEMVMAPRKRPFCNAFTGCGRKRSQGAPGMPAQELIRPRQYTNDESLGTIFDSVNAIGDLFRQIEMQTKHWEAFQDEMARKQDEIAYNTQ